MGDVKKLSVKDALKAHEVERHNAAIGNVVCALSAIADQRRYLKKLFKELDDDEKAVNDMVKSIDDGTSDPVEVNDSHELFLIYNRYRDARHNAAARRVTPAMPVKPGRMFYT